MTSTNLSASKFFYFQWHFVEECNLRCRHCYQEGYSHKILPREDIFRIAEAIDSTLCKWGKLGRVSLTGGEPFLQEELLFDILNFLEQSPNFYWLGVLTNGTLITEDTVNRLKKISKLKEVQVSIDGSSGALHDQIRGMGSFQKAVSGIQLLKQCGIGVSLMFTVHRSNMFDVVDVIDLAKELKVDYLTIERVTPCSKNDNVGLFLTPSEVKNIYQNVYHKKNDIEQTSGLKIRVSRPLWTLIDDKMGGFCPVGLTSLAILHDGTVLPCRRMNISIGNVLEDGLFKIWYSSEVLWKIRNKNLLEGKCNKCAHIGRCGGCRAIAYSVKNNYLAEDPQCWR